ncbi:hypothetical protein HRbin40_01458 [bacterium HR40]|nr:hypothetical protein HRbin40_01458 [bacterium HR40]
MASPLGSTVARLVRGLQEEVRTAGRRLFDRHLRLAVTGLRRSGKTVFTTALAYHLRDGRGLPFFRPVHEGRYLGALSLDPPGPPFPLDRALGALRASPPSWPEPTRSLSTLRLELRATATGPAASLQPIRRLLLDIVDYPGEWLLDLVLLDRDFAAFSELALALAHDPKRVAFARDLLALLAETDGGEDVLVADRVASAFRDYLRQLQREDFALVLPGRMIEEEAPSRSPPFAPLPPRLAETPLWHRMAERYAAYRERVLQPFFAQWFARFDRQIVLVDLLAALGRGPAHFADTREALALALAAFRYGKNGRLRRLLAPRIERVLFAMSKADHVAPNQHANARELLRLLVADAARAPRLEGVRHEVMVLAALRSTDVLHIEHQGQLLSCVRGRLAEDDRETVLFPGEVPHELPQEREWTQRRFRFRRFAPRRLSDAGPDTHIRLDRALDWLIGDRL